MFKKRHYRGFTLLEILIFAVIISVFLGALTRVMLVGKLFQKEAQNRSIALSIASTKMEEYLARAYGNIAVGVFPQTPSDDIEKKHTTTVTVTEQKEGVIPFKNIEVVTQYDEQDSRGGLLKKEVRLVNLVSYPYVHLAAVPPESVPVDPPQYIKHNQWTPINGLKVIFSSPVKKDILIFYNISLKIEDFNGIGALHTIYTACYVDDVLQHVVTRTPIISQPLISNMVTLKNILPEVNHTVEVRWYKDTDKGVIALRKANMVIMGVENID